MSIKPSRYITMWLAGNLPNSPISYVTSQYSDWMWCLLLLFVRLGNLKQIEPDVFFVFQTHRWRWRKKKTFLNRRSTSFSSDILNFNGTMLSQTKQYYTFHFIILRHSRLCFNLNLFIYWQTAAQAFPCIKPSLTLSLEAKMFAF